MVCAPVRSIIPSLKLGDYLSVQAHNHALSPTCIAIEYVHHMHIFSTQLNLFSFHSSEPIKSCYICMFCTSAVVL